MRNSEPKKQVLLLRPWDTATLKSGRDVLTIQNSSGLGNSKLITIHKTGRITITAYRPRRKANG
jgi:hypothetical protein